MRNAPYVSICIPAYGMGGEGGKYLRHSLEVLAAQDFTDFEVVVADQSDDDVVADVCNSMDGLSVRHIWTRDVARQNSANTNAALGAAHGEIVKILFQDDFLYGPEALGKIVQPFEDPATQWCLTGCVHSADGQSFYRPFVPRMHGRLHFGKNTVSSPSVVAVRRGVCPRFDEKLVWLMDGEFYHRCAQTLGAPAVVSEPLVVNRIHAGQLSNRISGSLKRREFRHVARKYRDQMSWGDRWHYLSQMRKTWI